MAPPNGTSQSQHSQSTVPLIIDGKDQATERELDVTNPQTKKKVHTSSAASARDALQAVSSSARAFSTWRHSRPAQRRDILLRAADTLESNTSMYAEIMSDETGASSMFTGFVTTTAASIVRDIACRISSVVNGTAPVCAEPGRQSIIYKEPMGVILAIAPWNAPYILGFRAVASAIAAGNSVVLKGSELSPKCFWAIGDVLRQAGLPDGVCNVIISPREEANAVTSALIEAKEVKKVAFTGSTAIGRVIAEIAGKNLKPCLLELGGKAPTIVCEDADLELAAQQCVLGALLHSGQICMSTERVIVHQNIRREFQKLVESEVSKMAEHNEGSFSMISEAAVQKSKQLVEDATSKGAKIFTTGTESDEASTMQPFIVADPTRDMDIYYTESFGPIFTMLSFEDDDEAVKLANDTEYGLNAAVFTSDLSRGLKLARGIEAGSVHINSMTVHDEPNLVHGGMKASGWGRYNGDDGINEFLDSKTVTWMDGEG